MFRTIRTIVLTRTEFLDTVEPAETTTEDQDCPICYNPFTDPVKFPCSHIFDRECATEWLQGFGVNTCPKCRAPLFGLPLEEVEPPEDQEDGEQLQDGWLEPGSEEQLAGLRDGLQRSGLQESRSDQATVLTTFGFDQFSESMIYDASVDVAVWLTRDSGQLESGEMFILRSDGGEPDIVRGLATLHVNDILLTRMVALGHLIPALAAGSNVPFSRKNFVNWSAMIMFLRSKLDSMDGQLVDIGDLAAQLYAKLHSSVSPPGWYALQTPFLTPHEEMDGPKVDGLNVDKVELDTIIAYVCYFVWREQQTRDEEKQLAEAQEQGGKGAGQTGRPSAMDPRCQQM
ncbi:hypothetical protein M409DRAFT_25931 [Zasmidium cellare ATCC 36951]|uniref:peptidylprolyl isomerase n=1 Tax=Zasmidium cellare ATCC 36951 TaxID=1080233 RepID=A0A6A6C987_ZASCE|nr:uncharacterized protein M409DRAFT_25931 [Zasmidium cellare ATCC 36951]KAF2163747.1 hypothetical protein M409DRAFT_25931 [Zasmidium cellare ATCC 36951]